ncbi:hypothetical protein MIMGU_mgv1a013883mg [Erythranthe guttata]|uniref:RING-type domain-containing protein n=1 Tax=Erythranthe guttata TaxID=4155 RepID=A0A022RP23_ERYGU|nr:hypothetical protein MIMGU_mgv1a013883mg [Erythranthe guttata]
MDSDRFNAEVSGNSARGLMWMVEYRLAEYWMSNDEISIFVKEAMDFAVRTAEEPEHASRWLIPIAVNLNVCTVQQEWEPIDSVIERAVREEKLVPYVIWPRVVGRKQFDTDVLYYLLCLMTGRLEIGETNQGKIRVEDVEDGMTIMPLCDICLRGPMLGTHISVLPGCNHAFHSHCIARRVLGKKYLCPTCQVPAYPYLQRRIPLAL